jgi:hypothetical protein
MSNGSQEMDVQHVARIDPPAYPTRAEVLADQNLLQENIPGGWRRCRGFAGALSLLVAANLTGCQGESHTSTWEAYQDPEPIVQEASDWVRSIFDDGSNGGWRAGRVMLGCVAIMPPTYLPEDEAMQVLEERTSPDSE